MRFLRQNWRRTRVRLARMPRRTRVLTAVLAAVIVVGGVWLALSSGGDEWVAIVSERIEGDDLFTARKLLSDERIASRVESGRLMVPRESAKRAGEILARRDLSGPDAVSAFEQLAGKSDIWSTRSQNDKRWQAAKMAALGKLVSAFPPVRSATVIFEPGSPRRLGSAGVAPTAAVTVRLQPGQAMTRDLLAAIADLVSGSIAGMTRRNIRIVDSSGRSYRLAEVSDAEAGKIEKRRLAEVYYREKLNAALKYIPRLVISVRLDGDGRGRAPRVSVCVPRSYLAAVYRSQVGGSAELPAGRTDSFARPHLAKIRKATVLAIGATDAGAVTVDWYYDVPAPPAIEDAPPLTARANWLAENAWLLGGGTLTAAAILAGILLTIRPRLSRSGRRLAWRRSRPATPSANNDERTAERRDESRENDSREPFAFLQEVADEDLLGLIRGEHPQAIALILSHVPPARAARVLANLPRGGQVEVARRIASLGEIDPDVAAEVEQGLADRVSSAVGSASVGGVSAVANILRHADYATEQSVLDGLSGSEPMLAGSLRRQMFVFEDISLMPPRLLGEALEQIESPSLAVALRTAGDELKQKALSSLSAGAEARVREEMERIGPVRLSDVESAQMRIAEAVRRIDDGQYIGGAEAENEILA